MTIRDRKALRAEADRRLKEAAYNPRRLVLLHSGITVGAALLLAVIQYILAWQVDANTGGLSGLQLRSMLETAGTVLYYAYSIAMPFWTIGLVGAVLRIARGQPAYPDSLLEGFRRFGPALRLWLLEGLLYGLIGMACAYIGSMLFMLTPFAKPLTELMTPMLMAETAAEMEQIMAQLPYEELVNAMLPALAIVGVLFLLVFIPISYRLRMAQYMIMDQPGTGAIAAMVLSRRMMKGNCRHLFRVDLSFWWYYVLLVLVSVIGYGDQLLTALGAALPVSLEVAFFGTYLVYVLAVLALDWWMLHRVQTTYAVAYDLLQQQMRMRMPQQPPAGTWQAEQEKEG